MPKRYSSDKAIAIVKSKGFTPINDYPGAKQRWKCKHDICGNTVFITLNSLQSAKKKIGTCVLCADNAPTPEIEALQIMNKSGLEPIVKFPGYDKPWKSIHTKCGGTVSPRFHSVKAGRSGCRKCSLVLRAIKQTTDSNTATKEMLVAGLEPLVDFKSTKTAWKSKCLKCGKIVSPQLSSIRQGRGCQYCANNVRLENTEAIARMKKFGVSPLVPYKNAVTPWRCRCMTCGKITSPKLNSLQSGQGACKYCSKVYVNPREAVKLMIKKGVEPKELYRTSITPWKCKCLKCGRIVYPQYSSVRSGRGGCRFCAATYISPTDATRVMKKAGYIPLEPYLNSKTKWKSVHKKCGRTVEPILNNIASGAGGCKWCGETGIDYSAPSYLYIVFHEEFSSLKVGISNDDARENRITVHKRNGWKLQKVYKFKTGAEASDCETVILRHLRIMLNLGVHLSSELMPQGGHTETVDAEELTILELTRIVDSYFKKLTKH